MDEQRTAELREELIESVDPGSPERPRSSDQESADSAVSRRSVAVLKRFLVTAIIVSLAASLFLIISITPTAPSVHVNPMQISNFSVGSSATRLRLPPRLTAVWDVTFLIRNPNGKIRIKYENPSVSVYYMRKLMWSVQVDSFDQKAGDEDVVAVRGDTRSFQTIDDEVVRAIKDDVTANGGVVKFDIEFKGRVGFYPGSSVLWGKQNMTAVCDNVPARFLAQIYGTGRVFFNGARECRVRLPMFP